MSSVKLIEPIKLDGLEAGYFTGLKFEASLSVGKNTIIVDFVGLSVPVYMNMIRTGTLGSACKVYHVDKEKKAVLLISSEIGLPLGYTDFEVGTFEVVASDKLVFEIDSVGTSNFSCMLSFTGGYGDSLNYRLHRFAGVSSEKRFEVLRKDFDILSVFTGVDMDCLRLNGVAFNKVFPSVLETARRAKLTEVKILDLGTPLPSDVFRFDYVGEPASAASSSSLCILHYEKRVVNKSCILGQKRLMERLRSDVVYSMKHDFMNQMYNALQGKGLNLDAVQAVIDGLDKLQFSDKNQGHYDAYQLPEIPSANLPS